MMSDGKFYDMLSSLIDGVFDETFKRTENKEKAMETGEENSQDLSKDASSLYEALDKQIKPQGKRFLVEKSGIQPHKWNPAIKELKDNGFVVQTGNKRGAMYSIVQ